mmetsp:Transcript_36827/g.77745  ORF Transcript_36827/g.77745 Transcript_36827/m.77745 type:complete len:173 (+) Transcript_36827:111-629(+)
MAMMKIMTRPMNCYRHHRRHRGGSVMECVRCHCWKMPPIIVVARENGGSFGGRDNISMFYPTDDGMKTIVWQCIHTKRVAIYSMEACVVLFSPLGENFEEERIGKKKKCNYKNVGKWFHFGWFDFIYHIAPSLALRETVHNSRTNASLRHVVLPPKPQLEREKNGFCKSMRV